jgi:PAS domain S-box-containing protein
LNSVPKPLLQYVVPLAAVAAAVVIRWFLDPLLGDHIPYTTFFAAVAIASCVGGLRPALLAIVVGLVAALYFFVPPRYSFTVSTGPHLLGLAMYVIVSLIIAGIGEAMRVAQRRFAEQAERLRITLASIGDAVITTDKAGCIANMNAVAESLTGWTTAEAMGQPLDAVFRIVNEMNRKTVENPVFRALKEGVIVGLANHTVLIAKDGTERPIDDSAAPIRRADGEVVGCVLVFRDISEHHRQQADQREARQQIETTLESVSDGFVRYDRDWRIVYVNAEGERINQLTRSEMLGRILWELFPVVVGTTLEIEFRRAVREQVTVEFENYYEPFDRWYSLKGYPTPDGGLTTFIRDVTEQKIQQEKVRRSEARIRRVFESNVVGMIHWDLDRSLILEANDTFLKMTGYTRDDVAAGRLNFRAMTPPEWTPRNEEGIRTIRADGYASPYEKEYFRKDGSRLPLIIAGTRFEDSPSEGMSILIDISESKRAEQEIARISAASERQRRLYETVLTNTPDFVYVFSLDHRVLYANDALIKMWGRGYDGAIGKTFLEIGYEPWHAEMHDREIDQVRATRQPIRGEVPFNGTNGRREYDYIFVPVIGANGEVEAVAGTTRDVTDRKRTEVALRTSEERLRLAMTAARMVAFEFDPATGGVVNSDNAADVFGLPSGSGLGNIHSGYAMVHPDDRVRHRGTVEGAVERGEAYISRFRVVRPDTQAVIWMEEHGHAIQGPGGAVRLVGVVMDVTARHEAEAALRASEEQFHAMANAMPQLTWMAQSDGFIYWYNKRWYEYTGTTPQEMDGWGWQSVHDPAACAGAVEGFHCGRRAV